MESRLGAVYVSPAQWSPMFAYINTRVVNWGEQQKQQQQQHL